MCWPAAKLSMVQRRDSRRHAGAHGRLSEPAKPATRGRVLPGGIMPSRFLAGVDDLLAQLVALDERLLLRGCTYPRIERKDYLVAENATVALRTPD